MSNSEVAPASAQSRSLHWSLAVPAVFALMGAFFWAIRGTNGYGGFSGGTLAGFGWATLWLLFSQILGSAECRPYGGGRIFAAIMFGVAFGGFTGYGIYTAWVNGLYQMKHGVDRELPARIGYMMLFLCGLHWGGVTGAFMSWCAPQQSSSWTDLRCWLKWIRRIGSGIAGAWLAVWVVKTFPQYFLPFWSEGYYQNPDYDLSLRAQRSMPNVLRHVGLFLGFFFFEVARRDWRAVKVMLVMSLGFAIPFAVGGYWHTIHQVSDLDVDWWKNWEMTIGLGGGLAFSLVFFLFNQPTAKPRSATRLERIFGIGLTMWFGTGVVALGAWEGIIRNHRLEESLEASRTPLFWAYQGIAVLIAVWWIWRVSRQSTEQRQDAVRRPVAVWILCSLVGLIVIAGYVTSIPPEFRLANKVLLTLYTFYIGTAGLLLRRTVVAVRLREQH